MGRRLNRHFSKENTEMANRHMKILNITNVGEMQIKTIMIPSYTCQNGYQQKDHRLTNTGKDVEKREPLYSAGGNVNLGQPL